MLRPLPNLAQSVPPLPKPEDAEYHEGGWSGVNCMGGAFDYLSVGWWSWIHL